MMNQDQASAIESVFRQFKIDAVVDTATIGPSVIRYEVKLGQGVRVDKVANLEADIAYATGAESVRIALIPGRSAVGIELPNPERTFTTLADAPTLSHPLDFVVGKDIEGNFVTGNLGKMPHLLVAGTTGSGKSSFINAMLVSLLLNSSPDRLKLVLIDPKMIELAPYNRIPHLLVPVITETEHAVGAIHRLAQEMDERYETMRNAGVRSIDTLNLPYIVVVVDELADLIMGDKTVEPILVRLCQKARAAGIHLVLATQRPSVDVVTGLLKANVPSRLAFAASNATDSRVVLDQAGAEALLGMGDALYLPVGARSAVRVQSAYVTDREIAEAVAKVKAVHRVDEMVDQLNPVVDENQVGVLEYLNSIIRKAQNGHVRAADFINEYTKPKRGIRRRKEEAQMELVTKTPGELGAAGDTLGEIAEMLILLRDQAMVEV